MLGTGDLEPQFARPFVPAQRVLLVLAGLADSRHFRAQNRERGRAAAVGLVAGGDRFSDPNRLLPISVARRTNRFQTDEDRLSQT